MSLAILFHFLCAQHISDINISIIRSLRLCCWITTLVVLFSVRCVLELWCGWVWVVPVLQAEPQLQATTLREGVLTHSSAGLSVLEINVYCCSTFYQLKTDWLAIVLTSSSIISAYHKSSACSWDVNKGKFWTSCNVSWSCTGTAEVSVLLVCGAVSLGNWRPALRDGAFTLETSRTNFTTMRRRLAEERGFLIW